MNQNTQHTLIRQYKTSKKLEVLGELYQPYMPLVYGVCLKYLKNRDAAQDAVMDIFEKLAMELLKHDTPDNFKTWLYVVVKNFCLMKLRKDGSENRAFQKMSVEFMDNGFSLHPLDESDEVDFSPALVECMKKLKERQRKAIELFYYKKLCYKEIADQLKTEEKKVKSDIQNGKRNLKICIENQIIDE
ncbi:MAG: sigma-70 family RNA polymerase sigma factor [Salinivirgaceae bacterium]|jgi:RNA polymerase sigma-70 factor (ECF subfamily)|nr:sigma-70 family RNA polymerase sigma factor [Salinivirgaceae bacterium]